MDIDDIDKEIEKWRKKSFEDLMNAKTIRYKENREWKTIELDDEARKAAYGNGVFISQQRKELDSKIGEVKDAIEKVESEQKWTDDLNYAINSVQSIVKNNVLSTMEQMMAGRIVQDIEVQIDEKFEELKKDVVSQTKGEISGYIKESVLKNFDYFMDSYKGNLEFYQDKFLELENPKNKEEKITGEEYILPKRKFRIRR